MKKKIFKQITSALIVLLICLTSLIPSVSAEEAYDLSTINLDDYGDVITNEELGFNISTSGIITKKQLEAVLNSPSTFSRAATTTITLTPCYDNNGNQITAVQSTYFHSAGMVQYRLKANADGSNAYCIEPGVYLAGGVNLTESAAEAWDNLSINQQRAVNTALCYGLEGSASTVTAGSVNTDEAYIATQLVVWEIVDGQRNAIAPFSLKSGKNGYLSMFCAGGANPNIRTAYNRITSRMSKFWTVPSMTHVYEKDAPTITLDAVYNELKGTWTYGSLELNDSNGVLSEFKLSGTYDVGNATVTVKQSGNKLTLTCSNGKLSGTSKECSASSVKNGVPKTNKGVLVAYGSPYAQDTITGGTIDPPVAYMNVKVNIKRTGTLTRDGRIQKSCWTDSESKDDTTMEGEGTLSTAENLQGWYFYVESSAQFIKDYKVNSFILGPTDKAGFTQSLSEYIIKNIDDGLTHDVPAGIYQFYELGKLKDGKSGKDLDNDYYFPNGCRSNGGSYSSGYPSGSIRIEVESKSLSNIGHATNIYRIPFQFKKVSECGASVANLYFTATHKQSGAVYLLRTAKDGYAYLNSDSTKSKVLYLPEGEYLIHELGTLKTGESGRDYENDYQVPAYYDTPTDVEVSINADAFKAAQEEGYETIFACVTNTVSSYIKIKKTDSKTGSALSGAVFGIYFDEECTSLLETVTTDKNGEGKTKNKYSTGTYYCQEITPPPNCQLSDEVYTVKVVPTTKVDNVVEVNATNIKFPTKVCIYKVAKDTQSPLSGVKFGVFSNASCTVKLEELTTDSKGCAYTKEYSPGTVLYIKELVAPSGYKVDSKVEKVTITETAKSGNVIKVKFENPPYLGSVAIEKKDSETGTLLKGAVYGLYSDKACTKLLEKLTTDDKGYAESSKSYKPSTMYLKEITPPPNYTKNNTVYTVTLTLNQAMAGTPAKVTVKDDIEKVRIFLFKYDPDLMAKGKGVGGATYGFYSNKECTQLLEKVVTRTDGSIISAKKYRMGQTVYIKELVPAKGYKLNEIIYDVTVTPEYIEQSKKLFHTALTEPDEPYVWVRVYDMIYKPYIQIHKTDSKTGVAVKGAVYELYDPSNKWATRNMLETDSRGYAKTMSTYYPGQTLHLKEYSAAEGYTLDPKTYEVYVKFVDRDNYVITVEVQNDPKDIDLTIKKTCAQTDLPVGNAVYGVYSSNAKDSNGMLLESNLLTTVTTDADGLGEIGIKFAAGEVFYLQERVAPYGFNLNKAIVTVTVEEDMNPIIPVIDYSKTGTVYLEKTDAFGDGLTGVTFEMYTKDGKLVKFGNYGASTYYYSKTGTKSEITIPSSGPRVAVISIPLGDYYFVETSTVDGKMVYGEKIPFTVKLANASASGATAIEIEVKNHDSVLWDTGGTGTGAYRTVALCVLTLSIALMGYAATIYVKKSKTKTN